jgi:CheY-like chemotaxis protein
VTAPDLVPKLRVLVADDAEDMRALIVAALHRSGRCDVVGETGDATTTLDAVEDLQPDLVLLDLGMPGGGLDVLPELRVVAPETTVVVVSGFPREDLDRLTGRRGAAGYVEKGLSAIDLADGVLATAGVLDAVTEALREHALLPGELSSGSSARRLVATTLGRWNCEDAIEVVQLLVHELVINAIVHARSEPDLTVVLLADAIRIEVADLDPSMPEVKPDSDERTSGRGMALIDRLASAWGVERRAGGKVVWFEVPRFDA